MNKLKTPNKTTIIAVEGTSMVSHIEPNGILNFWVSIGYIGSPGIFIDKDDWKSFVRLVNETDDVIDEELM